MSDGARLGVYQANALVAPVLMFVAWMFDADLFAALMLAGAGIGWFGWARDFDLRWTP